jgi:hypothetical protein
MYVDISTYSIAALSIAILLLTGTCPLNDGKGKVVPVI